MGHYFWAESAVQIELRPLPSYAVLMQEAGAWCGNTPGRGMVEAYVRHAYTNYEVLVESFRGKEGYGLAYITIKARAKDVVHRAIEDLLTGRTQKEQRRHG